MMNEPEKSYHGLVFTERYGAAAYIARCRAVSLRNTGSILAPLNAFLLLQGIETVAVADRAARREWRQGSRGFCATTAASDG